MHERREAVWLGSQAGLAARGVKVVGGKRKQASFYLGFDEEKTKLANLRLESLWWRIETTQDEPAWDEVTYEIGKAIARGEPRNGPSCSGCGRKCVLVSSRCGVWRTCLATTTN